MMGQAAPVDGIGPLAKQIEHLRKGQRHQKVIGAVRVGDHKKGGRFTVAHAVELHFVIGHDLPELGDVEGSQPSAAANKYAARRLAAGQLVLLYCFTAKQSGLRFSSPENI